MKRLWPLFFLLSSVLGSLVSLRLISSVIWLEGQQPSLVVSQADIKAQYQQALWSIEESLGTLMEGELNSQDASVLSGLRQRLLNLTVPAEAREFHLSLVFKLQQLENLLKDKNPVSNITLENIKTELKTLVVNNKW